MGSVAAECSFRCSVRRNQQRSSGSAEFAAGSGRRSVHSAGSAQHSNHAAAEPADRARSEEKGVLRPHQGYFPMISPFRCLCVVSALTAALSPSLLADATVKYHTQIETLQG